MKYSIFKVVAVKTKYEDLHFSWHLEFFVLKLEWDLEQILQL